MNTRQESFLKLFLAVIMFSISGVSHSQLPRYHPFTDLEYLAYDAPIVNDESSDVSILSENHPDDRNRSISIYVEGELAFEPNSGESFRTISQSIVDIDGNGLDDVLLVEPDCGALCEKYFSIFSQVSPRQFTRIRGKTNFWFGDKILVDFDWDEKLEIITSLKVGRTRNENFEYMIYRAWRLQGDKLVNIDSELGFPRAIEWNALEIGTEVDSETLTYLSDRYISECDRCWFELLNQ